MKQSGNKNLKRLFIKYACDYKETGTKRGHMGEMFPEHMEPLEMKIISEIKIPLNTLKRSQTFQ